MKNVILGLLLLSSVSAFADTYTCTLNTENNEQTGEIDEVFVEKTIVSLGVKNEIKLETNKKIIASLEDGDTSTNTSYFKGMNLLIVSFFIGKTQVAHASAAAVKGAKIIFAGTWSEERFVNAYCKKN